MYFFMFFVFYFLETFYWSIVDLQCCVSFCKVNQPHIYIYPLSSRLHPHIGIYRAPNRVPCAIQ